jgi:hypothetical protein
VCKSYDTLGTAVRQRKWAAMTAKERNSNLHPEIRMLAGVQRETALGLRVCVCVCVREESPCCCPQTAFTLLKALVPAPTHADVMIVVQHSSCAFRAGRRVSGVLLSPLGCSGGQSMELL